MRNLADNGDGNAVSWWRVQEGIALILATFLSPLILMCFLGFPTELFRIEVPFIFGSDTSFQQMFIKPFLEGYTPANITSLSAPFHHNAYIYGQNSYLDFLLAIIPGLFLGDNGTAINVGWLLKTAITGLSMTWVLRRMRVTPLPALVTGILFSLSPYALFRNVFHYNLSLYFIPPACLLYLGFVQSDFLSWSRTQKAAAFLFCLAIGLNGPYEAFFTCFLFAVGGVAMLARRQPMRNVAAIGLATLLIIASALAACLPGVIARAHNPRAAASYEAMRNRVPVLNENGLRIRRLVGFTEFHPIQPLGFLTQSMDRATEDKHWGPRTESTPLGILGLCGLIAIFLALASGGYAARERTPSWVRRVLPLAFPTVCLILLAVPHGLSNYVGTFITAQLRNYSRVTAFITFFSFAASAVLLDELWRRSIARNAAVAYLLVLPAIAVMFVGTVYDQKGQFPSRVWVNRENMRQYDEVAQAVTFLEQRLEPGASVWQMPVDSIKYDHLRPWTISRSLRWSYAPLMRVDEAEVWFKWIRTLPMHVLPAVIMAVGFDAVWIDLRAYEQQQRTEVGEVFAGVPDAVAYYSPSREYFVIDISRARSRLAASYGGRLAELRAQILNGELPPELALSMP
ncbi:MAG TPA: hypothetical protein PKI11_03010 [Candidatus Hydrogenedentes bacterium]|nr:hypothetical protein [Candidatus Hydrogenedentota bacterium]